MLQVMPRSNPRRTVPEKKITDVWMELELPGDCEEISEFREAFSEPGSGFLIHDPADKMIDKVELLDREEEVVFKLAKIKVKLLGFTEPVNLKAVYAAANKHGLDRCTGEIALALRLKYRDQPLGHRNFVAMKSIRVKGAGRRIFSIDCASEREAPGFPRLRLRGAPGELDQTVHPEDEMIFVVR